jgi:cytochrome c-type biogenesis protein CcmF
LLLLLVLLMGVCPLLGWGRALWRSIRRNFLFIAIIVVVAAVIILATGAGAWYAVAAVFCGVPLLAILLEWYRGVRGRRRSKKENCLRAFFALIGANRARYGGLLAHIGIILIALGVIGSSFYGLEKTVTLDPGESVAIGSYELTYNDMAFKQDSDKLSAMASVSLSRDGDFKKILHPSLDHWYRFQDEFAEVAVRTTPAEDLFVSLTWTGYDVNDKTALFRVLVNPLVVWIWAGGAFWLLGAVIAFYKKEEEVSDVEI